ncbi:hypothetical protein BT67DRAFT_42458 [Trichocladium antarcticum]|uniref:Uncharacterized protein n=1 Tax=Trichocladium antarcticum TaxID=1450529 RepID=A0AAN6ZDE3_9PEZI|nr:hypothetical protein BT67DRAFT_42458 [Trichocladium antarcticum]
MWSHGSALAGGKRTAIRAHSPRSERPDGTCSQHQPPSHPTLRAYISSAHPSPSNPKHQQDEPLWLQEVLLATKDGWPVGGIYSR